MKAIRALSLVSFLASVQGDFSCVCTQGTYNGSALSGSTECDSALSVFVSAAARSNCSAAKRELEATGGWKATHVDCCGATTDVCPTYTGGTCTTSGCDAERNAVCVTDDARTYQGVTLPATKRCMCRTGMCVCHGRCIAQNATCVAPSNIAPASCDKDTSATCLTSGCDSSRNAVCGGFPSFTCTCPDGTCNCRGTCVAPGACQDLTCAQGTDTGGTCRVSSCNANRNAQCTGGKCMCGPGLCACNGQCKNSSLDSECVSSATRVFVGLGLAGVLALWC